MISVSLGNAGLFSDSVGVVTAWQAPEIASVLGEEDLRAAQLVIAGGSWRESHQSPEWVGFAIATALKLDAKDPADRPRVRFALGCWISSGALKVIVANDKNGEARNFVVVGVPVASD